MMIIEKRILKQGDIIMGENEVIIDLSDIRLLVFNLSDEHEVTNEAVKQLLFCIDSKMDKYRDKEVIVNGKS